MEKKNFGRTPSRDVSSPSAKTRSTEPPAAETPAASKPWTLPSAAPARTATSVATAPGPQPTRDEIAERAKALWKARGCTPGRDVENWLEAERQLRTERGLR